MGLQPDLRLSCMICFSILKLTRKTDLAVQQRSQRVQADHQTPKRQDILVELATNCRQLILLMAEIRLTTWDV